jgi:hypothetical protein
MSDSQTVTIPAAQHAATAETRPVRLLKVLAQNPEPLSTLALASLLAEPGQHQRLLASCDGTLRRWRASSTAVREPWPALARRPASQKS